MNQQTAPAQRVAVLIPCLNEEAAIGRVLEGMLQHFPPQDIYVFDNASTDRTAEVARGFGVQVVLSPRRGKGNVIKHMFESVEADVYLMLDGDDTYFAKDAPAILKEFNEKHLDMVIGDRARHFDDPQLFRRFHTQGNNVITLAISRIFKNEVRDIFSGYRAFSRDFVKNLPLKAEGFDIEAEMTLQALSKRYRVGSVEIAYGARPLGSQSKLDTFTDGFLVIKTVLTILKNYTPLFFYSMLGGVAFLFSLICGLFPILDFIRYQYVHHVPLAILASGLAIIGMLCFAIGLILDTILALHNEQYIMLKKLASTREGERR